MTDAKTLFSGLRLSCLTLIFYISLLPAFAHANQAPALAPEQICGYLTSAVQQADIASGNQLYDEDMGWHIQLSFRPQQTGWSVATIDIRSKDDKPLMLVRVRAPCQILQARRAQYSDAGELVSLQSLAPDLTSLISEEPVNPAVPPLSPSEQTKPVILALADTGVNYLLPDIQPHLARDSDGGLIGYDFWDDDRRLFDIDPRRNPYYPFHHGTTVFSVLAAEAPDEPIAVFRFPALHMCRYKNLIDKAAEEGIKILNLSMGSRSREDWTCFEDAARRHPSILFIVSAGNDGLDIDNDPVYPASVEIDNLFVVSSSDAFGRPGPTSNLGSRHVDILVPAEQMDVIDHRGVRTQTGGTSYAAPRVAALAARYLRANPEADTQQIVNFLQRRTIAAPQQNTAYGWIPDPTDDFGF